MMGAGIVPGNCENNNFSKDGPRNAQLAYDDFRVIIAIKKSERATREQIQK